MLISAFTFSPSLLKSLEFILNFVKLKKKLTMIFLCIQVTCYRHNSLNNITLNINKYITNVIYIEIAVERSGDEISCNAATLHIQARLDTFRIQKAKNQNRFRYAG